MGGVVLVCTSKAKRWASKTLASATNCRVVSSLLEPQCWDRFLLLSAQLQTFPCSLPGWYPVKIYPKCLFSGCSMSCINTCVIRTFHALGYPVTEGTFVVGCITGHPTAGLPIPRWDTPNTHTPCPQTPFKTPHAPSCRTEEQLQHEKSDYQDHVSVSEISPT